MATIEKRGDSYRITVSAGYDITGKQLRQRITWTPAQGMTNKQIEKEINRQTILFEDKVKIGKYIDSNIKFAVFANQWMEKYAKKELAPLTVASYQTYLKHINEAIGTIQLNKLRLQNLIDFYSNLSEKGIRDTAKWHSSIDLLKLLNSKKITKKALAKLSLISENTVRFACAGKNVSEKSAKSICKDSPLSGNTILHYHHLISSILTTAVQWQIIAENPAGRIKPPKAEEKEAAYLNPEQARHLIELLDCEPVLFRVITVLALYSGFRREEICGLEWEDVDFKNNVISIRRASQCLPKKGVFTAQTKTKKSKRSLQLASSVFHMLQAYEAWQLSQRKKVGDRWHNSNRLFTTWDGKPIRPDTVTHWVHDFIQ